MMDNHIDVPDRQPCAFCEYLAGRRPFSILEVGDLAAILVTREQRGNGHVLVLPVAHRETILDLTTAEGAAIMSGVQRAARAIDRAYAQPGLEVWQNNGTPAHQAIPHVHFHVAGTLGKNDTERGPVPELSVSDTDRIASELRAHLP